MGFDLFLLGFTEFYRVFSGFLDFFLVLTVFIEFYRIFERLDWVLTCFYWVLPSFTEFLLGLY